MKIPSTVYDPLSTKTYKYAHYKRDGHFVRVIRSVRDGLLLAMTSGMKDIAHKIQSIIRLDRQLTHLPRGATILCELWQPGLPRSQVITALNEGSSDLHLDVFAIETFPLDDLSSVLAAELCGKDCYNLSLQLVDEICNEWRVPFIEWTTLQGDAHLQQLMAEVSTGAKEHCEGLVLKNGNLLDWCKWKPVKTIDLIISGHHPGKGKYLNQIGSIICNTTEGYTVADVSGMNDLQRQYITQNASELIGKIVEVEYQNVGARGRLEFPRFKTFREDKQAHECKASQDAELERFWTAKQPLFTE